MRFEWDENKRQSNLLKHRIDFVDVRALFDGRPNVSVPATSIDEQRFATTGQVQGRFVTVIWTWRGDARRIISARSARDGERRAYRDLHGR